MTAPFGWVRTPEGLLRDYVLEGYIHTQQELVHQGQADSAEEAELQTHLLLLLS